MRRSNAPTLQDVAQKAGVTAMAASVALNGARSSTRVSEQTRARILSAAAELGYRPNAVARGLSRRRMDTVGVVAVVDGTDVNFYFLEVLNGILEAAAERQQNVLVFSVKHWDEADPGILRHCDGRVDGMVLIGPIITPPFAETLFRHAPFVTIHGNTPMPGIFDIRVDDEAGAFAAVRHLLSLGHRRIAHFGVPEQIVGGAQRRAGYRRALAEVGVAYDPGLMWEGAFTIDSGRLSARALLANGTPLPTAIFCVNDAVAFGCVETLTAAGVAVPGDVSVFGFDDSPTAMMANPPIATVRQPFREMGRRAMEALIDLVDRAVDEQTDPVGFAPAGEMFPVELVLRESIAAPPVAMTAPPI
jgi:LacI family transcriptional regulator